MVSTNNDGGHYGNREADPAEEGTQRRIQGRPGSRLQRAGRIGRWRGLGKRSQCQPGEEVDGRARRCEPSHRKARLAGPPVVRTAEFVPVAIAPAEPVPVDIRIEARRGDAVVKVEWPIAAAGECAAWLRQWLE
jgi:hypothetical protein